jgi:hypothetical protein
MCSLCNEPVELETAKTDENGSAVHEECYTLNLQPEDTKYIAVSPMTLNCPRCGAIAGQVCEMLHGEVEVVHVERIVAAASKDDAV